MRVVTGKVRRSRSPSDVAPESVDDLLAALCDHGIDCVGRITLEPLDAVLYDL